MDFLKKLFYVMIFAFLLNLAWEVPHSLLYKTTTEMPVKEYVPRILQAAAGDIIMVLIIFLIISLFNKSFQWEINKKNNLLISIISGIIISTAFELYSLSTDRFAYLPAMPLIPFTTIGLTPVLQMIIMPLFIFFFSEKLANNI